MKKMYLLLFLLLLGWPNLGGAQTIDCDAPAPTVPGSVRTGQPFTVQFCVPSVVTTVDGDVPNRIDGFTAQVDANAPSEAGKLTLGPPSAVQKLSAVSFRATSGVPKGAHTVKITPWNCPLDAAGVPMTTCTPAQKQNGPAVAIPFVASDPVLTDAPPPIQKGRVIR